MSKRYSIEQAQAQAVRQKPIPKEFPIIGGLLLLLIIVIILDKSGFTGSKKQVIGRARWATFFEVRKSQTVAYENIHNPKISANALWINEPRGIEVRDGQVIIPFDRSCTYVPGVNGSVMVMGAPEAGKSFSVIVSLEFSSIFQGHSIIEFDAKGNEAVPPSCTTGGHALSNNYEVYVIDPTGDDTDSMNLWGLIRHAADSDSALGIGETFIANSGLFSSDSGGNSGFFSISGATLIAAIMLFIKSLPTQYQDFVMVLKIMALPRLVERIRYNEDRIPEYVKFLWAQFLSLEGSEETAQNVIGTATAVVGRMLTPEMISAFRGDGNVPASLDGRQMVIFRMNPDRVGQAPLIGAAMEMLYKRSLFKKGGRTSPIGLYKDEAPQLKMLGMSKLLNLQRSLGGYCVFGAQGRQSFLETHSPKETDAMIAGCKTLIFGGVKGNDDTEYFSKSLWNKQVTIKGNTRTIGKNNSKSTNEGLQTSRLLEPHEVEGLRQGYFVFKNPVVGHDQGSRPFKKKIKIYKREENRRDEALESWHTLRKKKKPKPLTEEEIREREALAYQLLPLPGDSPPAEIVNIL